MCCPSRPILQSACSKTTLCRHSKLLSICCGVTSHHAIACQAGLQTRLAVMQGSDAYLLAQLLYLSLQGLSYRVVPNRRQHVTVLLLLLRLLPPGHLLQW